MASIRKYHLQDRVNELISAPVGRIPLVEVTGSRRILIENHMGIISYEHGQIGVKSQKGSIEISGQHLEILCMSKEKLVICGLIDSIRFLRGD